MKVVFILAVLRIVVVDPHPIVTSISGNCCEVKSNKFTFSKSFIKSDIYNITKFCGLSEVAEGYCDAVSDGGGWLVAQRRKDGSVDFNRPWVEYEEGFGNLDGEFWYGLRPLHCLTSQGQWQLRIDFTFSNGTKSYLVYNKFAVGPASSQYQLSISGFSGTTSDDPLLIYSLDYMKFTTKDRDNDLSSTNCAIASGPGSNGGGWWYKSCSRVHPNHQYALIQIFLNGKWEKLSFTEMKVRPLSCAN